MVELFSSDFLDFSLLVVFEEAVEDAHQGLHQIAVAACDELLAVHSHKLQGRLNQLAEQVLEGSHELGALLELVGQHLQPGVDERLDSN